MQINADKCEKSEGARIFWRLDLDRLTGLRPNIKWLLWESDKRAVLSQILAGSFLEPDFGKSGAFRAGYWIPIPGMSRNGRFQPNPDREPFGARFGDLAASGPAIKLVLWEWGETAVFSQILTGSPLEPDLGTWRLRGQLFYWNATMSMNLKSMLHGILKGTLFSSVPKRFLRLKNVRGF